MMEINDFSRGCKTACITISLNQFAWVKKNGYSLSRVTRKAIDDLMNDKSYDNIQELSMKVDRMGKLIQQQAQFIENNKLTERFGHFQDKEDEAALKRKPVSEEEAEQEAEEVLNSIK